MSEKETKQDSPWTLRVPRRQWEQIMFLAKLSAPNEIQMLAEITRDNSVFTMGELHLVKQTVTGAHAEFDDEDLAILVGSHANPETLRCWVHSHVNMGVFWSGTDQGTIERLSGAGWVVSLVMTLDGKKKARLDVGLASAQEAAKTITGAGAESILMLPERLTFQDIRVEVPGVLEENEKTRLRALFEEKVGTRDHPREFLLPDKDDGWESPYPYASLSHESHGLLRGQRALPTMDLFKRTFSGDRKERMIAKIREKHDTRDLPCESCAFNNAREVCKKGIVRDADWLFRANRSCDSWLPEE